MYLFLLSIQLIVLVCIEIVTSVYWNSHSLVNTCIYIMLFEYLYMYVCVVWNHQTCMYLCTSMYVHSTCSYLCHSPVFQCVCDHAWSTSAAQQCRATEGMSWLCVSPRCVGAQHAVKKITVLYCLCTWHMSLGTCPSVADVFRLYCGLEAGQRVRDLCMMQDLRAMNVDER